MEAYVPPELIIFILNFFNVLRSEIKFSLLESKVENNFNNVMVIGHNPGLTELINHFPIKDFILIH